MDTIERADGTRSERDIAGHPGAVAVIAIDPEDRVLLVRQWRTPAGQALLEIPAGTLDVDEASGATEDPDLAARRELEEETGHRAGSWTTLAAFWTAPGFASELMHLYLATDLTPAHPDERLGPDEDEHLRLERLPFADAVAAVEAGGISDAKSIVGLLWVDRLRAAATAGGSASDASARSPLAGATPLIEKTFTFTVGEVLRAGIVTMRRSRFVQAFGLIMALLAIPPIVGGDWPAAAPGLILAVVFTTGLFSVPFGLFAMWRYRDRIFQPSTVTVSEAGLKFRAAHVQSETEWRTFSRLREESGLLFLESGPQTLMMPLRIFSAPELATFRRLAAQAGIGPDGRPGAPPA